jgi:hypothetical protein
MNLKYILFFTALFCSLLSYAQPPDWNTAGNTVSTGDWFGADTGSDMPISFEHQANHASSSFLWSTTTGSFLFPRMILTRPGWLGINTTTPLMRFHVEDGGILSTGTIGTNTVTGAGTRLMWIPDMAAFRAGRLDAGGTANFWDAANVGIGSAAFGTNNRAAGEDSFAQGQLNNVTGECSMAFGGGNEITQNLGFAIGRENDVLNTDAITLGFRNEINESGSILMGTDLRSNAQGSITIGRGANGNDKLINTEDFSIMLGSLSDVPTLFVSPSAGVGTFGNVGIGNITAPTEVLDVNGTARLRVMTDTVPHVLITGLQADTTLGDYVLHYRPFPNDSTLFLAGDGTWQTVNTGADCDWELVNGDLDIVMGFDSACVERAVGIGTPTPRTKLQVDFDGPLPAGFEDVAIDAIARTTNDEQMADRIAVRGTSLNEDEEFIANSFGGFFTAYGGGKTYGIFAESFRSPTLNLSTTHIGAVGKAADVTDAEDADNIGVQGLASNAYLNCGVKGESSYAAILGGATPMWGFGVQGIACGANRNFGVYGVIPATCSSGNNFAGFFQGDVTITGTIFNPSDENLKLNIEDFAGGLDLINQLNPKTYQYDNESYANMNLPSGNQYGLIAGELQEVLPNLTRTVVSPGEKDEEGNVIFPEVEFTGVNYTGLVPILVAAVKEQQTIIENQNEALAQMMVQLAAMQQQINECCNSGEGNKSMPGGAIQPQDLNNQKSLYGGNELFQNIPNPFRESTTISYSLEEGGRVQLSIYDKTGKVVTTLTDANQGPGRYSEVWNANGMPSGVYHYALYVNGELLVKRAIKLQE